MNAEEYTETRALFAATMAMCRPTPGYKNPHMNFWKEESHGRMDGSVPLSFSPAFVPIFPRSARLRTGRQEGTTTAFTSMQHLPEMILPACEVPNPDIEASAANLAVVSGWGTFFSIP